MKDKFWDECSKEEQREVEEIVKQFKEARRNLHKAQKAYRNKIKKLNKKLDECEVKYEAE